MPLIVSGNILTFNGRRYRCAVGKHGFTENKKEGDGKTPTGTFALRECWYRADRIAAPDTKLPLRIITEQDGWCDDPASPEYNKHIKVAGSRFQVSAQTPNLKPQTSYEKLYRDDHCYDLIVPLGYNDAPIIPGKGSAIFLHIAKPDYAGTQGCVALAFEDLLEVLRYTNSRTTIEIVCPTS